METKQPDKVLNERYKLLRQVENWLEIPIITLGIIWLILLVLEFVIGLNPLLNFLLFFIWGIFIIEFLLRFVLAPQKLLFLRKNLITMLALVVPALRIFRVFHAFRILRLTRTVRSIKLFRVISSLNRGFKSLRRTFGRKGFGYVFALTIIITLVGAAGMYVFESPFEGFTSYGDSLWWTVMMMTTSGSGYWPQTLEGRILAFFLAIYAFTMFGYVTATIASFFIEREADSDDSEIAGQKLIKQLHKELREIKEEIRSKA
jgi:voltage-gated potassium channel